MEFRAVVAVLWYRFFLNQRSFQIPERLNDVLTQIFHERSNNFYTASVATCRAQFGRFPGNVRKWFMFELKAMVEMYQDSLAGKRIINSAIKQTYIPICERTNSESERAKRKSEGH